MPLCHWHGGVTKRDGPFRGHGTNKGQGGRAFLRAGHIWRVGRGSSQALICCREEGIILFGPGGGGQQFRGWL